MTKAYSQLGRSSQSLVLDATPKLRTLHTTACHPQLRDLIVCPNKADELFYVHNSSIYSVDYNSCKSTVKASTAFWPNCLNAGCGLLAMGGHQSELGITTASPKQSWFINTQCGSSINNSISIIPTSYHNPQLQPILRVANNDEHIYSFVVRNSRKELGTIEFDATACASDQPVLESLSRIRMNTAVNHTSTSPDGKTLVAVGDNPFVRLFAVNSSSVSDSQHTAIATVKCGNDANFSTAFSPHGDKFAVASQDGIVTIWDVRNLKYCMKEFATVGEHPLDAARVVKFCEGPNELFAFTEQANTMHLVDARTFELKQTFSMPVTHTSSSEPQEPPSPASGPNRLPRHLVPRTNPTLSNSQRLISTNAMRADAYSRLQFSRQSLLDDMAPSRTSASTQTYNDNNEDYIVDTLQSFENGTRPRSTTPPYRISPSRNQPRAPVLAPRELQVPDSAMHQAHTDRVPELARRMRGMQQPTSALGLGGTSHRSNPIALQAYFHREPEFPGELTGLCFDPLGSKVYVGTSHAVACWDIDEKSRRRSAVGSWL